ncbi:hypothetical protein CBS101457_005913 [Exobasidium rhododendri]|nr:hypothetical protein CBS101457_005913 [Exobasidium rhododendri]
MHAFTSLISLVAATSLVLANLATAGPGPNHIQVLQRRAAAVTPTSPGPGESFNEGSQCAMEWTVGTGSAWKSMTISLMTGANQNMTFLTNVTTGLDGTTTSSHSWTCPEVTPNSAIYFYQFTDSNGANPAWTTRFTIAGSDGSSTTPSQSTQDGESIPWGEGALATTSSSTSSGSSTSASTTSSSSSSSSASSEKTASSTGSTSSSSAASAQSTTGTTSSSAATSGASTLVALQSVCIGVASIALAVVIM